MILEWIRYIKVLNLLDTFKRNYLEILKVILKAVYTIYIKKEIKIK